METLIKLLKTLESNLKNGVINLKTYLWLKSIITIIIKENLRTQNHLKNA